jgi:CBS-domain-containing membrane protein
MHVDFKKLNMNLESPVSSIMTTKVECVNPTQKIVDLKHIYEQQKFHHHIPVVENNQLVGMVSLIDFMREIHNATLDDNEKVYQETLVKEIMSVHPVTISTHTSIREAAELLAKGEFHSLVVSDNGAVSGILTTSDLLQFLLKTV